MRDSAIAILVLAIFVVACDDESPATTGPPPDLQPISVRVDGPAQLTLPAEIQFTALQTWSDGSTRDVTASAQWTSTNPSVLSIIAGRATALAGGEVGVTARFEQLTSQPRTVRVFPATAEWDGLYTLTIGGGPCNESLPLQPELTRRTYTAAISQNGLTLVGTVPNVGVFLGRIVNPEARFSIFRANLSNRIQRASLTETLPLTTSNGRLEFRAARYDGTEPAFVEVLDGYRLVISGNAVTTMSPAGFAGTFIGELALHEPTRRQLIGVCSSSSHGFTLVRK